MYFPISSHSDALGFNSSQDKATEKESETKIEFELKTKAGAFCRFLVSGYQYHQ